MGVDSRHTTGFPNLLPNLPVGMFTHMVYHDHTIPQTTSSDTNPDVNPVFGTVDGSEIRRAPVDTVGSLSHYLQEFINPSWCRISSINNRYVFLAKTSSHLVLMSARIWYHFTGIAGPWIHPKIDLFFRTLSSRLMWLLGAPVRVLSQLLVGIPNGSQLKGSVNLGPKEQFTIGFDMFLGGLNEKMTPEYPINFGWKYQVSPKVP